MFGKKSKKEGVADASNTESQEASEAAIQESDRPAPKPVPKMNFDPEYSPTCILDLKKVVHSIHESKGQTPPHDSKVIGSPSSASQLLDAIVEEAHLLRQSGAET